MATEKKQPAEIKYKVIMNMTQSEIQSIGSNKWIKRKSKPILGYLIGVFVVGWVLANKPFFAKSIYIAIILGILCWGIYLMVKSGKAFFITLDTSKPIDLTEK